ncbi:hypothetical protein K432DRAFT_311382 [Lepidopterella palustris CBS 459.81]|uniref:Heterokaryon incompatibility domain-containing protein n=1 Tax=Lepidopterella palustris CBS 459.81 TaxID=1314670 RepID=A0A8E2DYU8_9PEZI|nr:hypothetical protein K432DRAFT_311382 [Lepidopterella palustris CBS 459.81]
MRLLKINDNDDSFILEQFPKDKIPAYAILSHTWGTGKDDKVTSKDVTAKTGTSKPGFKKLDFCSTQSRADGLHYFWVDTCCIDKSHEKLAAEYLSFMACMEPRDISESLLPPGPTRKRQTEAIGMLAMKCLSRLVQRS